jgi:hypothetical protein
LRFVAGGRRKRTRNLRKVLPEAHTPTRLGSPAFREMAERVEQIAADDPALGAVRGSSVFHPSHRRQIRLLAVVLAVAVLVAVAVLWGSEIVEWGRGLAVEWNLIDG